MRAPDWTTAEFTLLVSNPQLSDKVVAELLPQRNVSAIAVVRSGIHSFHIGGDISMLSKMMINYLTACGQLRCSICDLIISIESVTG